MLVMLMHTVEEFRVLKICTAEERVEGECVRKDPVPSKRQIYSNAMYSFQPAGSTAALNSIL
jgi:hypothetical protein